MGLTKHTRKAGGRVGLTKHTRKAGGRVHGAHYLDMDKLVRRARSLACTGYKLYTQACRLFETVS